MPHPPPNTAFVYLYRDADNYKQWGKVVFAGPCRDEYHDRLRAACIDGSWFVAKVVGVPEIFLYEPGHMASADHEWHEWWELEATDETPTDRRPIEVFIEEFEAASTSGSRGSATTQP